MRRALVLKVLRDTASVSQRVRMKRKRMSKGWKREWTDGGCVQGALSVERAGRGRHRKCLLGKERAHTHTHTCRIWSIFYLPDM